MLVRPAPRSPSLPLLLLALALGGCDPGSPAVDDRLLGAVDMLSTESCEHVDAATEELAPALSEAEATSALVRPDTPYRVTLPEGAVSYAALEATHVHGDYAIFTDHHGVVLAVGTNNIVEVSRRHAVCGAAIDEDARVHIHEPSRPVLRFSAEGPRELWLLALGADSEHTPDGGADLDAGLDHTEDAGAGL